MKTEVTVGAAIAPHAVLMRHTLMIGSCEIVFLLHDFFIYAKLVYSYI